jgi:hypothetical protein
MSGLDWNGDAILARAIEASKRAIDSTTASCVPLGREYVNKDTRLLESTIASVPAEVRGDQVVGAYGSVNGPDYALPQEFLPPPRGNSYIRRPATEKFPDLPSNLREEFARG